MKTSLTLALLAATLAGCSASGPENKDTQPPAPDLDQSVSSDTATDGTQTRFDPQVEQALQQVLDAYVAAQKAPGAIAVVEQGTRAWRAAVGDAEISSTKMTLDHLFHIGSVTKVFVATLVLMLQEEGLLSVDDPLSKWVPDFPNGDAIPLFRLLNHTSGIFNFKNCGPGTPEDLVQTAITQGPEFAPGTSFGYSNTNYILLGLVIEAATKEQWHVAQRKRILEPYGLTNTFVAGKETISGDQATGYLIGYTPDTADHQCFWSAGGMVSSASDLIRFISLLSTGAILSPTSLKKMRDDYAVQVPPDQTDQLVGNPAGSTMNWGLGIAVIVDGTKKYFIHGGWVGGYRTCLGYREPDGAAAAVFINGSFVLPKPLLLGLFGAVQ